MLIYCNRPYNAKNAPVMNKKCIVTGEQMCRTNPRGFLVNRMNTITTSPPNMARYFLMSFSTLQKEFEVINKPNAYQHTKSMLIALCLILLILSILEF